MGETRKKKRWSPEEIAAILKRVLLDRAEVSKLCEEAGAGRHVGAGDLHDLLVLPPVEREGRPPEVGIVEQELPHGVRADRAPDDRSVSAFLQSPSCSGSE